MKYQSFLFLLTIALLTACGEPTTDSTNPTDAAASMVEFEQEFKGKKTTVMGMISGLDKPQKIFIDQKTSDAFDIKTSVMTSMDGEFSLNVDVEKPAIYRLRIGGSPILLILKGGEVTNLEISMNGKKVGSFSASGSDATNILATMGNDEAQIKSYIEGNTSADALVQLALVERLDILKEVGTYRLVEKALKAQYPESSYLLPLSTKITQAEAELNRPKIAIGEKAPNIVMKDVNGKERSLADLEGKVVLLDFWASWCMPCRRENPNVVKAYNKYNKKGFEIFSVSLDGFTDQESVMFNNPERFEKELENRRQKWLDAIEKDGLIWDNHVSELRSWDTEAAKLYQVPSIPRTFLLDRDGVIRYMNLRGSALEKSLEELL